MHKGLGIKPKTLTWNMREVKTPTPRVSTNLCTVRSHSLALKVFNHKKWFTDSLLIPDALNSVCHHMKSILKEERPSIIPLIIMFQWLLEQITQNWHFKHQRFILLKFCRPEVWNQTQLKSRCHKSWFILEVLGKSLFPHPSSSQTLPGFLGS